MPTKMVSKESSIANPSFRVLYYGNATGAVPFLWESRPGTPKHALSGSHLVPPLTPPPSHHTVQFRKSSSAAGSRRSPLGRTISFLSRKKSGAHFSPSSSVSSRSSSSTWSSISQTLSSSSTCRLRAPSPAAICCVGGVGGGGGRATWKRFFGGTRWLM